MSNQNVKKLLLTGATGFVGKVLVPKLIEEGYELTLLARNVEKAQKLFPLPIQIFKWDAMRDEVPAAALEGVEGIVNLIGEGIADKRWSPTRKRLLEESRTLPLQKIARSLKIQNIKAKVIVGASAIGIYEDRAEEYLSESSESKSGYLGKLCQDWESETQKVPADRHCMLRIGIVLGQDGGALKSMLPPFRIGFGGRLGNGQQWMSWIHIEDLSNMILHSLKTESMAGPINAVAPTPVRNLEFTKAIASGLKRPAPFPVPTIAIKLLFGELSKVLLSSQKVSAEKVLGNGFRFKFPLIEEAMKDILAPKGIVGAYRIKTSQWFKQDKQEVFNFFSEAKNLETITPPWLNFKVTRMNSPKIQSGTLLDYKIKLHGIPLGWRTLIESWEPQKSFVDTQLKGPYSVWHHTHTFNKCLEGTMVHDEVIYKLPLGRLGEMVREVWVVNDLNKIFGFRRDTLNKKWGENSKYISTPGPVHERNKKLIPA